MSEEKGMKLTINAKDIAMVDNNILNAKQLKYLLQRTPEKYIYKRPAKGGGEWKYVKGSYVEKVLNLMFGWDWDFEVKKYEFDIAVGQAIVLGTLTCRVGDKTIVKEQFGRADIKFKVEWIKDDTTGKSTKHATTDPLDLGNDLKAATTDALKKCASKLGIASDVYAEQEFNEVKVVDEVQMAQLVKKTYEKVCESLPVEEQLNIERIIETKEENSYSKALKVMQQYQ